MQSHPPHTFSTKIHNLSASLRRIATRTTGLDISRHRPTRHDAFFAQKNLATLLSSDPKTIFDIGAHHGTTLQRYKQLFPNSTFHLFEPYSDSFAVLQHLTATHSNIHLNQACVADDEEPKTFYINHQHATNSLFPRPTHGKVYYPRNAVSSHTAVVPSVTIDAYASRRRLNYIDILKMDIQGGELDALKGASQTLQAQKIGIVFTEVMYTPHYQGAPLMPEIWTYLRQFGYTLYNLYNHAIAPDGQLRQGDAIFVSPKVRSKLEAVD